MNKCLILDFKEVLRQNGVQPHDQLLRLDVRRQLPNTAHSGEALDEPRAEKLYRAVQEFRKKAADESPFSYISKLNFAERLVQQETCSVETIITFLADRYFLFSEYRDIGTLAGDGRKVEPAPDFQSLILSDEPWQWAEQTPAELLQIGQRALEDCGADPKWTEAAQRAFELWLSRVPQRVVEPDELRDSIWKAAQKDNCPEETMNRLLYGYCAAFENWRRAKTVCEREWLPSTAHERFYEQMKANEEELRAAMQSREDEMRAANRLIAELNRMANHCASVSLPEEDFKLLSRVVEIFEIYVRSLLRAVRKTDYFPILTLPDHAYEKRPYVSAIRRLLAVCRTKDGWHPLTPLFLYEAFAENTKIVLEDQKPKLVKKISRKMKAARVSNLTSQSGRRAAVNLVLYQKLMRCFTGGIQHQCLLGRTRETCAALPHADADVAERIAPEHCTANGKRRCPFARTMEQINDFGFALVSGYGWLYHHRSSSGDTYKIPYPDIYPEKNESSVWEDDGTRYAVWDYQMNLHKPVGMLEGVLEHHIRNCMPNRPGLLTPTSPNTYAQERGDPFASPYEELAALLLQDMHLPAMHRIIRQIKRILSEHPEYLSEYRKLFVFPCTSEMITEFLQQIIKKHGLERQIPRYDAYNNSGKTYNIRDSLQAVLEYEMRAQLYETVQDALMETAKRVLPSSLFLYSEIK